MKFDLIVGGKRGDAGRARKTRVIETEYSALGTAIGVPSYRPVQLRPWPNMDLSKENIVVRD